MRIRGWDYDGIFSNLLTLWCDILWRKIIQAFLSQPKAFLFSCSNNNNTIMIHLTGLLPGHLFSSEEMAGGRSKISSALNRLALEIPLDLYCVVFTNIIEHTWEWVQLPIINTLCQYRLTFQSVIFKIYSITRNSPTLKLKLSFGTNFLSNFLKGTTR